MTFTVATPLCN